MWKCGEEGRVFWKLLKGVFLILDHENQTVDMAADFALREVREMRETFFVSSQVSRESKRPSDERQVRFP